MYKVEFEVRDTEVDIQGVVNHVNYSVYMAHARHKFLKEKLQIDFIQMAQEHQNLFLISSSIEFKKSLKPGDKFYVTCSIERKLRIRFVFEQEIRLLSNDDLIAKGCNIGVCMDGNKNRPYVPEKITQFLER